jgi:hypothetical protein
MSLYVMLTSVIRHAIELICAVCSSWRNATSLVDVVLVVEVVVVELRAARAFVADAFDPMAAAIATGAQTIQRSKRISQVAAQ